MCHLIILLLEIYVNKFKMWTKLYSPRCLSNYNRKKKKKRKSDLHFQQWDITQIDYVITIMMIMTMVEEIPVSNVT